jgi:hypothetical protein
MAVDAAKVDTYLYSLLSGESSLTSLLATPPVSIGGDSIYFDTTPQEVTRESGAVVIIRHKPSPQDAILRANFGVKLITDFYLQIVANKMTRSYAAVDAVAEIIEGLLDLSHSSEGHILKAELLAPYRKTYTEDSREFRESGADWLIQVSQFA